MLTPNRQTSKSESGGRWLTINVLLYVSVASTSWAIDIWWARRNRPPYPFDSGFLTEMVSETALFLVFSSIPLTAYLLAIHSRRIRTRIVAICWSPAIGMPLWMLTGFSSENLLQLVGPGLLYGLIVRLPKDAPPSEAITRRTPAAAVTALMTGIGGVLVLPGILSIPAIVVGQRARRRIQEDPTLAGEALASAGVVLGWIGVVFASLGGLVWVVVILVSALRL